MISVPTTQLEAPGVRLRLERISVALVLCDCEAPVEYAYTLVVYAPGVAPEPRQVAQPDFPDRHCVQRTWPRPEHLGQRMFRVLL